jgi:hypothetical protein
MFSKIKNFIKSLTEVKDYDEDLEEYIRTLQLEKNFQDSMYELELLREKAAGRIYDV